MSSESINQRPATSNLIILDDYLYAIETMTLLLTEESVETEDAANEFSGAEIYREELADMKCQFSKAQWAIVERFAERKFSQTVAEAAMTS